MKQTAKEVVGMDAKLAITAAKKHFGDIFSEENIINVGLEEVRYDEDHKEWLITLGFSWPWEAGSGFSVLAARAGNLPRYYKLVTIKDDDGRLISITNRNVAA